LQYQRCCEDLVQVYAKDELKLQVLLGFVADRVNEKGNCVLCMSHDQGSVKFGNDFQDQVIKVRVSKDGNAVSLSYILDRVQLFFVKVPCGGLSWLVY